MGLEGDKMKKGLLITLVIVTIMHIMSFFGLVENMWDKCLIFCYNTANGFSSGYYEDKIMIDTPEKAQLIAETVCNSVTKSRIYTARMHNFSDDGKIIKVNSSVPKEYGVKNIIVYIDKKSGEIKKIYREK